MNTYLCICGHIVTCFGATTVNSFPDEIAIDIKPRLILKSISRWPSNIKSYTSKEIVLNINMYIVLLYLKLILSDQIALLADHKFLYGMLSSWVGHIGIYGPLMANKNNFGRKKILFRNVLASSYMSLISGCYKSLYGPCNHVIICKYSTGRYFEYLMQS